jgi:hypothetical protein
MNIDNIKVIPPVFRKFFPGLTGLQVFAGRILDLIAPAP